MKNGRLKRVKYFKNESKRQIKENKKLIFGASACVFFITLGTLFFSLIICKILNCFLRINPCIFRIISVLNALFVLGLLESGGKNLVFHLVSDGKSSIKYLFYPFENAENFKKSLCILKIPVIKTVFISILVFILYFVKDIKTAVILFLVLIPIIRILNTRKINFVYLFSKKNYNIKSAVKMTGYTKINRTKEEIKLTNSAFLRLVFGVITLGIGMIFSYFPYKFTTENVYFYCTAKEISGNDI